VTISELFSLFAGWLFYGGLIAMAGGLGVVLLYAVLRSIRWLWEHRV
jgi:hypothetical protein